MVTRTFKMMERTCRVYDKDSGEMKDETFTAKVNDKKMDGTYHKSWLCVIGCY